MINSITLNGLTKDQKIIAECLWNKCQTQKDVDAILHVYGHQAHVVYNMIVAAAMDQYQDTEEALYLINNIKKKYSGC